MEPTRVEGQSLEKTYEVNEDIVGEPMLGSLKCDYSLCEADFLRLTGGNSLWNQSAIAVFLISVGYALSIAAKFLAAKWSASTVTTEPWEYWALALGFVVALLLYGCSRILPNDRQAVLKDMKEHFEKHPRKRQLMGRNHVSG